MTELPPGVVQRDGKYYAPNHPKAKCVEIDTFKPPSYELDFVEFIVPGEAVPKSRPRVMGKGTWTFTPKRTVEYEKKVKDIAARAMGIRELFEFGIAIGLEIYKKNKRHSDIDNVFKAIADACNGVVYEDDSQINEMHVFRFADENPRVRVTISGKRLKRHIK